MFAAMDPMVRRLCYVYLEPSTWLLLVLVCGLLTLSSYRSTTFSFAAHAILAKEAESNVLSLTTVVLIPVAGSVMLLLLFFFLGQLFYALVVLVGLGAFSAALSFWMPTAALVRRSLAPRVPDVQRITLRGTTYEEPFVDMAGAGAVAALLVAGWLVTKHWLFVDALAVCLASEAIKTLRIPNLAVATGLLCTFFVYDVFWVFLSPLLFSRSVMVSVAVGVTSQAIPLPLLLQIPKFVFDGAGLLGLGDIILPGVLLAFLFRIDTKKVKTGLRAKNSQRPVQLMEVLAVEGGYFLWALFAYALGLLVTLAALAILQMGQPALLYLVPACLGTTLVRAVWQRELRDLWWPKVREPEAPRDLEAAKDGDDFDAALDGGHDAPLDEAGDETMMEARAH